MSRELEFDGYWEGAACFSCDNCGKTVKFRFDDEESAKNVRGQRRALENKRGWIFTKVNGVYRDFCGEDCRNQYVKKNTL